ncbi:MAG TPA: hypothetical protein VKG23_09010 [Thermoanaerobaculia bacterium]|nr:hypothetical protein [Thermoanaerobaculia bacterium]
MKLSRNALAMVVAASSLASISLADDASTAPRSMVERLRLRNSAQTKATAATASYSVEVPYVQSFTPPGGGQGGTLVLNQAHSFNVTLVATDQHNNNVTGNGVALPQTDTFGYFSLPTITQNPSNPEVFVKILDGTPINGNYWVFYGHLTDLIYDLTVTDNVTGITHTYSKAAGNTAGGFDTTTFPATAPASSSSPAVGAAASNAKAARATTILTPNAFLRTSVDISNNTSTDGVTATLQYCYSSGGAFVGCTNSASISLGHFDNFHQDDVVGYLASLGLVPQSAVDDSFGTLLVTFFDLPSLQGWEGTVSANTYNRVSEVDPLRGTVGCGVVPSLFFESATGTVVGTARDTVPAPSAQAGSIQSSLGVHNTDAKGTGQNVSVNVTLYDPSTGAPVGNVVTLSNIAPGELRVVDDLFSAAAVPTNVTAAIVFVDTTNSTSNSPTIEGFILDQDTDSLDTRYHEMLCAAGCF